MSWPDAVKRIDTAVFDVTHYSQSYMAFGYRPWFPSPMLAMVAAGGGMPPRPPPLPRPRPRPRLKSAPGIAKSGFAALASRITSSCLGRRGPPYGPGIGLPGGGLQLGLIPRCETEVKWDASDAAGDREPSGNSSYESLLRTRLGSLLLMEGLEVFRLGFGGFGARPPGMRDAGIGGGGPLLFVGSANLGSTSS